VLFFEKQPRVNSFFDKKKVTLKRKVGRTFFTLMPMPVRVSPWLADSLGHFFNQKQPEKVTFGMGLPAGPLLNLKVTLGFGQQT